MMETKEQICDEVMEELMEAKQMEVKDVNDSTLFYTLGHPILTITCC